MQGVRRGLPPPAIDGRYLSVELELNGVAGLNDRLQELTDHPTMRRMRQVPRERLFVVEVNDDREIRIALGKPEVRSEGEIANFGDLGRIPREVFCQGLYRCLLRSFLPRQEVHVPQHQRSVLQRLVAELA
jgi:hypothetical protein